MKFYNGQKDFICKWFDNWRGKARVQLHSQDFRQMHHNIYLLHIFLTNHFDNLVFSFYRKKDKTLSARFFELFMNLLMSKVLYVDTLSLLHTRTHKYLPIKDVLIIVSFLRFFFYKFCIVWNCFILKTILILQKYFFLGSSNEWQIGVFLTWTEVCHQSCRG